jgi:hypothetical protein
MALPTRFRPRFGRFLAVTVVVLCIFVVVQALATGSDTGWSYVAPAAFVAVGAWAVFWQPSVEVGTDAIVVHNILRSVRVPWARLRGIDTRYALALEVDSGRKVTAWAAPAPGATYALRLDKRRLAKLPVSTYYDGTVRAGDDEGTDSGLVALVIRREWERRDHDADADLPVETTWHVPTAVVLGALAVASVVSIVLAQLG